MNGFRERVDTVVLRGKEIEVDRFSVVNVRTRPASLAL